VRQELFRQLWNSPCVANPRSGKLKGGVGYEMLRNVVWHVVAVSHLIVSCSRSRTWQVSLDSQLSKLQTGDSIRATSTILTANEAALVLLNGGQE